MLRICRKMSRSLPGLSLNSDAPLLRLELHECAPEIVALFVYARAKYSSRYPHIFLRRLNDMLQAMTQENVKLMLSVRGKNRIKMYCYVQLRDLEVPATPSQYDMRKKEFVF